MGFSPLAVAIGLLAGAVGLLLSAYFLKYLQRSRYNLPPERSSWIPWLGCALTFGKAPLYFIKDTKEALGDIFTIHAAGRRMTFVIRHHDFKSCFFQNTNTDFQAAVQPFTMKAAGFTPSSFFKHHSAIHDAIKAKLVPSYLHTLCPPLSRDLYNSFLKFGKEGEMDLMAFVRQTMFDSAVKNLYGTKNVPQTEAGMREMEQKFVKYDEGFEYGTQLPECLLREWSESKYWLIALFKKIPATIGRTAGRAGDEQLMIEKIIEIVGSSSAPSSALLFLWASQANAIPIVFWCLAYILASPSLYATLQSDVENINFTSANPETYTEGLKSTMSVRRCVLEAVRLHAPGMIIRKVIKTHKIGGYDVPAGHYLMLSPYWSHRDNKKFPEPESFNPDRWLACDVEKNQFLDGFVGFGGGRYQCPGRWLALMEMHLCVAMAIQLFDMQLLDPIPDVSPLHLIGVQHPNRRCRISFRNRR